MSLGPRLLGLYRRVATRSRLQRAAGLAPGTQFQLSVPGLRAPITLRAGTSDLDVFHQIFHDNELGFRLQPRPRIIVDAGANIGLASLYLAARFPRARIVALEVDETNFALLQANTRAYRGRIEGFRRALWSNRATVTIDNPEDQPWSLRVRSAPPGSGGSIDALGVADLLDELGLARVDLLKLDIEGAEREVLGQEPERWIGRVGTLAVELHDRLYPGCTAALETALAGRPHRRIRSGEYDLIQFEEPRRSRRFGFLPGAPRRP